MNLTYCEYGYLPFVVPTVAASLVGPRTEYPIGYSLGQVMQIYWQAASYQLTASGSANASGTAAEEGNPNPANATISVQFSADAKITRNVSVTNGHFYEDSPPGMFPVETEPTQLTVGRGVISFVPSTGSTSGSDNSGSGTREVAPFNITVALFFPLDGSSDPVVFCNGLYYPAISLSQSSADFTGFKDGSAVILVSATTRADPNSTVAVGSFNFFGSPLTLYGPSITGQSVSISGSLSVASTFS